jgi:FKBP-type peptidyl-prolyl cis-trans isomerase FklB
MNLIQNAFIVTSLMAFSAFAQTPAPAPQPTQTPQLQPPANPSRSGFPAPSTNRPPGLGPGPMQMQPKAPPVMPEKEKLSYAIGFNIGSSVKRDEIEVNVDTLAAAMKDVLENKPTRYDEKEVREIMTQFQGALRAKMANQREKQAAEAKAKSDEYLAQNAKDPAVKSLPNGLQYKVLKDGSGAMPKPSENVTVAYKGRLIDGTTFDQNDHFTTPVTGRTIKGWSEILPMMKIGSKWEVTIPPDLGYGARAQPKIPANSVLVFEMELLSIAPPTPAPTNAPSAAHPPGPAPRTLAASTPPSTSTSVVSGQIIKVPSADELKKGAKIEVITNPPPPPPTPPGQPAPGQ